MKTISSKILALLLILVVAGGVSCVLEEKVIEIVVTGTTCVDFHEDEDSENFTTPMMLNYAAEIDSILEDNGLDRSDIHSALVVSASYTVTDFSHVHDWVISGEITIERNDVPAGPEPIINYTNVSLTQVVGIEMPANLNPLGVDLLNDVLYDYVHNPGAFPVITFTVVSETGDVDPDPTPEDHLVFDWTACITIHVTLQEEFETPELF